MKINDPKLFHLVVLALRDRGVSLTEGVAEVTISDTKGDIVVRRIEDIEPGVERAICLLKGKSLYDELLIGIDTNSDELTVAVLGDGELLTSAKVNFNRIEEFIQHVINVYPHRVHRIGVGVGNKLGEFTYRMLTTSFDAERVDEKMTSKNNPYIRVKDRDVRAACAIALRAARGS
ncbi:hypothetical protein HS1genome_0972 [Sulfodiicoccus acidiphilus]|uniref:Uncharacterized protein n=1 Tax=Sulfodiicoccus acidiphilus TaxID=1670455 RepID=A0A348B331_9CREN|nr:hypothetical protein HS1genome_0972 [Sulfodiicoccus acidiphilus]GGT93517.1 hypothetical protein GCM10007116_09030 [Sulfodiicoccus acidiphilus]